MGNKITKFLIVGFLSISFLPSYAGEPVLGDIKVFGFNFCPRGWAEARGQTLPINQNQSLYSLFGTTYGGDGRNTFALPDLRGRAMMGTDGTSPLGSKYGAESVTLDAATLPSHSHSVVVKSGRAATENGAGNFIASAAVFRSNGVSKELNPVTISLAGGSQAHNNMPPYLTLTHCVATTGIFPSRN